MALMYCRECGDRVSSEAPACPHCGVPDPTRDTAVATAELNRIAVPSIVSAPADPGAAETGGPVLRCPHCKTDHVQRLSVIYQDGTSVINTTTGGVGAGVGGGGLGVGAGGASTSGTSRNLAAIGAAPPKKKEAGGAIGMTLIGGVFSLIGVGTFPDGGIALFVGLVLFVFGAAILYRTYTHNRDVYPKQLQKWWDSYRCSRCGQVFQWGGSPVTG